jgi:hypothetical protein
MKPGDTFLADLGLDKHLHIVLSHPFQENCLIVVAMISTYDEDYKNTACILRPSDGHPFIKHLSYVAYNTARIIREDDLAKLRIKQMPAFSEEVLQRVLKGADAVNSDLPNKCWIVLDDQGLIPQ